MTKVDVLEWGGIIILAYLIGIPVIKFVFGILVSLIGAIMSYMAHVKTRNTPAEKGQIWQQGDSKLYITRIIDNGTVCMQTKDPSYSGGSYASWCDSAEDWKNRVENNALILLGRWDAVS